MSRSISHCLSTACKVIILILCSYIAVIGRYPPLLGEPHRSNAQTIEDSRQDDHLLTLDDRSQRTEAQIASLSAQINELQKESSERTGEERIIGAVIAFLTGGGLILQFRRKKESD